MSNPNPEPLGGDSITCARCWRVHTECHLEPANRAKAVAHDEGRRLWSCALDPDYVGHRCAHKEEADCGWVRIVREVEA